MFGGAFAQSVTYDWTGVVTGVSGSTGVTRGRKHGERNNYC